MAPENTPARAKRAARTARRRAQTRAEILESARKIVLRDGFAGFSLAPLAEELGMTKPALYYYFPSKQALLSQLLLDEWLDSAAQVEAAVARTDNGVDAVEQIMRTLFGRYRDRPDLFLLGYQRLLASGPEEVLGAAELERMRPVNDMLYAGAEERLRTDQASGTFPRDRDPRRFVFTAHLAVIGLLNMKLLVESLDDPLIHGDDELIDDLCRTFRDAATKGGSK